MTTAFWSPGFLTLALFDSGLTHFFYEVIKIVVVAAAALVGWMAGPSFARVLVRLAFHRQTPPSVQTVARLGGAVLAGFLAYYLIKIGPGWGGGTGDGDGDGNGRKKRADREVVKKDSNTKRDRDIHGPQPREPEIVTIRVLGGNDVKQADHYYQMELDGRPEQLTDKGVERALKEFLKNGRKIKRIDILLDKEKSVLPTNPVVTDLEKLCQKFAPNKVRTSIEKK
jgi:hypothetical protein